MIVKSEIGPPTLVVASRFPSGLKAFARGWPPAANGDPGTCTRAPVVGSTEKTVVLPLLLFAVASKPPELKERRLG